MAGLQVVSTWIESVEKVGESNPRNATTEQHRGWAQQDLSELRSADVLWMLAPEITTRGAWVELGYKLRQAELGDKIRQMGGLSLSIQDATCTPIPTHSTTLDQALRTVQAFVAGALARR